MIDMKIPVTCPDPFLSRSPDNSNISKKFPSMADNFTEFARGLQLGYKLKKGVKLNLLA
jgi:hypothetical protein